MKIRGQLLKAWAFVAGATGVGLWYAQGSPADWATVLILGVTATIAAWYADATQELAEETRRMADSTRAIAENSVRSDVRLHYTARIGGFATMVTNYGPGIAVEVEVLPEDEGAEPLLEVPMLRRQEFRMVPGAEDHGTVLVRWQDTLGNCLTDHWRYRQKGAFWHREN